MKLLIDVDLDNAAFGTTPRERKHELNKVMYEQVLRTNNLRKKSEEIRLMDSNGNTCGWAKVVP